MAQADWQRHLKNTALSENRNHSGRQNHKRRTWQYEIDLSQPSKNQLKNFITGEREYYNVLYHAFASRARTFPESVLSITGGLEQVYLAVAETGFGAVGPASRKKDCELPEAMEPLREFITGKGEDGKRNITDRASILFEQIGCRSYMHSGVKRRMAKEFLDFYKAQAKLYLQKVPERLAEEQAFRVAPEALESLDDIRKRHIQIPKELTNVKWDEENERTLFYIPFIKEPIIVEGINFAEEKHWNYIIIHQLPGKMALGNTPWVITLRNVKQGYMLKYLDVTNPNAGAAFNVAKARKR